MDEETRQSITELFGYKQVDFSLSFRYLGFNLKPNGYGKSDKLFGSHISVIGGVANFGILISSKHICLLVLVVLCSGFSD